MDGISWDPLVRDPLHSGGRSPIRTAMASATSIPQQWLDLPDSLRTGLVQFAEISPLPMYALDPDDRVVLWNGAAAALLGWSAADVVGRTLASIGHCQPAESDAERAELGRASSIDRMEVTRLRSDGKEMCLRISAARVLPAGYEGAWTIVILEDATEQKRAEAALRESEARLRSIFDAAGDAIFVFDEAGRIESFNPACVRMFGYQAEDLRGAPVQMLVPDAAMAPGVRDVAATIESGRRRLFNGPVEVGARRRNGESFPAELAMSEMMTLAGRRFAGTLRDISIRKRVEESARRLNEELSITITELEEVNRENRILSEMRDMLQTCHSVEEVYLVTRQFVPRLIRDFAGALYMLDSRNELLEPVVGWGDVSLQEQVFASDACWALRRGRIYSVHDCADAICCKHLPTMPETGYVCVPLMAQGDTLGLLHLQPGEDAAEQRSPERLERVAVTLTEHVSLAVANVRLRERLRLQATKDGLTGLFNRRFMEEVLERESRRALRKQRQLAVFMVDIDHFKRVNDLFGHEVGDLVLREVATCLKANIRQEDFACRYGGEEFLLVLPESDLGALMPRALAILNAVRALSITHLGQPIGTLSVSIGMAAIPQHGRDATEVVRSADQALYRAKNEGRNRAIMAIAQGEVAPA